MDQRHIVKRQRMEMSFACFLVLSRQLHLFVRNVDQFIPLSQGKVELLQLGHGLQLGCSAMLLRRLNPLLTQAQLQPVHSLLLLLLLGQSRPQKIAGVPNTFQLPRLPQRPYR